MNIKHAENVKKYILNKKKEDKMVNKNNETDLFELQETLTIENTHKEIINGVELIVECASDQEFYKESDKEENEKPRSKTIIIREKPNDSEVDISSSETDHSDSYKILEVKKTINNNLNNNSKLTKKRERKKSNLSKTIISESENSIESNSDDEDYSPVKKKKVKKFDLKKNAMKSTEIRKGGGRPRGRPPKINKIEKKLSDAKNERIKQTVTIKINKKDNNNINEELLETKNLKSINESKHTSFENKVFDGGKSNNDTDSSIKNENKRNLNQCNIKKINTLKKFIRTAGIKVHCYQTLLKGCKTNTAKVKCLHEFLEKHGILGRPTLKKCKKLRIKNSVKEVVKLYTKNII